MIILNYVCRLVLYYAPYMYIRIMIVHFSILHLYRSYVCAFCGVQHYTISTRIIASPWLRCRIGGDGERLGAVQSGKDGQQCRAGESVCLLPEESQPSGQQWRRRSQRWRWRGTFWKVRALSLSLSLSLFFLNKHFMRDSVQVQCHTCLAITWRTQRNPSTKNTWRFGMQYAVSLSLSLSLQKWKGFLDRKYMYLISGILAYNDCSFVHKYCTLL